MDFVQITKSRPGGNAHQRKPSWLKVSAPGGRDYAEIRRLMRGLDLHTVCEEAHCKTLRER